MNVYEISPMSDVLKGNSYVGRGIVIGKTPDGTHAVTAYFIMGRSANSRNRIFVLHDGDLFTEPFDPARVEDPSLIIYAALRQFGNRLIVTNGDQTDTVRDGLAAGKSFSEALASRSFEPDRPNFTARISGMVTFASGFAGCASGSSFLPRLVLARMISVRTAQPASRYTSHPTPPTAAQRI